MNLYLNVPVADIERSRAFYTALGWRVNEAATDDNAVCFPDGNHFAPFWHDGLAPADA